ncbi:Zn-ribbon domain-containing OB-fold protein [Rhodococcoides kyotonense]|uniref:ChsH2 C-terminal OB-fold domain-containing protein n=1 Tax=Rhodococcoides kyotonense TaxID=398843 RepID=A0A177YLC5_9NOCA|nr:OB-fold domain-containing protein [Rhodococcus kyotonensis]OAK56367.1 hypothetical protein A3K89_16155 [Rhodococcus kyotonensis]
MTAMLSIPLTAVRRDAQTADFFDGTARGQFLLREKISTGELFTPQTAVTDESDYRWVPASGRGRVISWTTVYGRNAEREVVPQHVLAVVELDEGPWWWTRLVADSDVTTGASVHAEFHKSGAANEHEFVPVFVLD